MLVVRSLKAFVPCPQPEDNGQLTDARVCAKYLAEEPLATALREAGVSKFGQLRRLQLALNKVPAPRINTLHAAPGQLLLLT